MQRYSQRRAPQQNFVVTQRLGYAGADPASPSASAGESGARHSLPEQHQEDTEVVGGVYVISVAARILHMHPQTLRKYERLGLVTPTRSMGMLRLYSAEDVLRIRLIKYMVDTLGMNLAGVEFALGLLNRIINLRERIQRMPQAKASNQFVIEQLEDILREIGAIFPNSPHRV